MHALPLRDASRPTRPHYAILAFAWGVWLFGFYSLTVFSFLLPALQRDLPGVQGNLGWLTGVAIGATGVGGFLFGGLADRFGRRASAALAVVTFTAGNALCAAAPDVVWLAVARGVAGLGIGGSWGAGQALIGETVPAALRGRFGALAQSGAPLGLGLAAIVGSFVAPEIGWRVVFALSALPALSLALLSMVPESDLWQAQERRGSVARELLAGPQTPIFWKCFVLTLLNMSNYWFAVSWLPLYLQAERGLTLARSGRATLCFVLGSLTGYLAFGYLSDRWGRRLSFTLFSGLMALGLLMFTVFWPWIAGIPSLVLVFLFVSGLGTGTWSSYGPTFSELFTTRVRGSALSIIMNLSRGVQFLAPVVIAAVTPRWGMAGGIALAAGFAVAAGLWIWTLPETRGKVLAS